MKFFNREEVIEALRYDQLIAKLEAAFCEDYAVPVRNHYPYESGNGEQESTLLLMPAWKNKHYTGLKIITVSPYNSSKGQPTIQGIYVLIDAGSGEVIAQLDAGSLTNIRTAASSALASSFLSNNDASKLLMLGTGSLAPEMIRAHCSVRPIRQVWVWGRDYSKAEALAENVEIPNVAIEAVKDRHEIVAEADIVSSATSSPDPLIFGKDLRYGQHIDLVGAFKPTWREADEQTILRSKVYLDTREGALKESGEILIPMKEGKFSESDITGDLFDLCRKKVPGRVNRDDLTSFISVGYALEDLAAAELVWEKYKG